MEQKKGLERSSMSERIFFFFCQVLFYFGGGSCSWQWSLCSEITPSYSWGTVLGAGDLTRAGHIQGKHLAHLSDLKGLSTVYPGRIFWAHTQDFYLGGNFFSSQLPVFPYHDVTRTPHPHKNRLLWCMVAGGKQIERGKSEEWEQRKNWEISLNSKKRHLLYSQGMERTRTLELYRKIKFLALRFAETIFLFKYKIWGWGDNPGGKILALYPVDLGLKLSTTQFPDYH